MPEQVEVTDRVRSALKHGTNLVVLRVEPADAHLGAATFLLLTAWADELPAKWPSDAGVITDSVWQMADGSSIFSISDPPSDSLYESVLEDLINTLTHAGVQSTVDIYDPDLPHVYRRGTVAHSTVVQVSPRLKKTASALPPGPSIPGHPVPPIRWNSLDDDTFDGVITQAVDWCQELQAQYYLICDTISIRIPASVIKSSLLRYLGSAKEVILVAEDYPSRARVAVFTSHAQLTCLSVNFKTSDQPAVALKFATDLIRAIGPYTATAFALRGRGAANSIYRHLHRSVWPRRADAPPRDAGSIRVLAESKFIDAFPVMFLGSTTNSVRPGELGDYTVTAVSSGMLMVTRQLGAWFLESPVTRDVIEQARTDLAPIILGAREFHYLMEAGQARWINSD